MMVVAFVLSPSTRPAYSADPPPTLRLTQTKGDVTQTIAANILKTAYHNIGIEMAIVYLPLRRALVENNHGTYDGETARFTVIEGVAPNLIRVPEPLFDLRQYGHALKPVDNLHGWQDIEGLRIGLEMGVVLGENRTNGMRRKFSTSLDGLLQLLRRGAIDILIYEDSVDLRQPPYGLFRMEEPLDSAPLYHYLHRSHADLVPKIAAELKRLRVTGNLDLLIAAARKTAP